MKINVAQTVHDVHLHLLFDLHFFTIGCVYIEIKEAWAIIECFIRFF